jgi:HPt (histidine-containing phosphotransfer) domain-containing protein
MSQVFSLQVFSLQVFSFDEAVYLKLGAELGEADTHEALQLFLADTTDKLATIEANSDARMMVKREAHSIKGSAATFGFNDLSRIAKQLEFNAETMLLANLQENICGLRQAFETTREFAQAKLLHSGR